jgi:hypothetical protein
VLVDDVAQLDAPPIGGLVELKVQRPYVVGALGTQTAGAAVPEAPALATARRRSSQAFVAPQPLDPLAVTVQPSRRTTAWAVL